jgi:hypothetical protein
MSTPEVSGEAWENAVSKARWATRQAAINVAREAGVPLIRRPLFSGAQSTFEDVEPLAGLRASREVELAARSNTQNYVRDARGAGRTWQEIGEALDLTPDGEADPESGTVAEAAYSYAAGRPDTNTAWRYGRSFPWTCQSCEGLIRDNGPFSGPADNEPGHAEGCPRLAAAVAACDAQWARFDADWEAGR